MAARTPDLTRLAFTNVKAAPPGPSHTAARAATSVVRSSLALATNEGAVGVVLKWSFYIALLALVTFCVLAFIHYTYMPIFKFTTSEGGIEIPTSQDSQAAFTDAVASVDVPIDITGPLSCSYSLMFDMFMLGDFKTTTAPRVLLYRSKDVVKVDKNMTAFKAEVDLLRLFPDTNFIVWVDPGKNDLYAAVVTRESGLAPVIHISKPIQNVPLRTPFRVGFVFDGDFLEIYMNGKLASTLTWKGTVKESTMKFYSPIAIVDQSIFIANVSYWSRILRPSEIAKASNVQNANLFAKLAD